MPANVGCVLSRLVTSILIAQLIWGSSSPLVSLSQARVINRREMPTTANAGSAVAFPANSSTATVISTKILPTAKSAPLNVGRLVLTPVRESVIPTTTVAAATASDNDDFNHEINTTQAQDVPHRVHINDVETTEDGRAAYNVFSEKTFRKEEKETIMNTSTEEVTTQVIRQLSVGDVASITPSMTDATTLSSMAKRRDDKIVVTTLSPTTQIALITEVSNEIRTMDTTSGEKRGGKFIDSNSTIAQHLNLPDAAEVWMLAGMKAVPHRNQTHVLGQEDFRATTQEKQTDQDQEDVLETTTSRNQSSEKSLVDWTQIVINDNLSGNGKHPTAQATNATLPPTTLLPDTSLSSVLQMATTPTPPTTTKTELQNNLTTAEDDISMPIRNREVTETPLVLSDTFNSTTTTTPPTTSYAAYSTNIDNDDKQSMAVIVADTKSRASQAATVTTTETVTALTILPETTTTTEHKHNYGSNLATTATSTELPNIVATLPTTLAATTITTNTPFTTTSTTDYSSGSDNDADAGVIDDKSNNKASSTKAEAVPELEHSTSSTTTFLQINFTTPATLTELPKIVATHPTTLAATTTTTEASQIGSSIPIRTHLDIAAGNESLLENAATSLSTDEILTATSTTKTAGREHTEPPAIYSDDRETTTGLSVSGTSEIASSGTTEQTTNAVIVVGSDRGQPQISLETNDIDVGTEKSPLATGGGVLDVVKEPTTATAGLGPEDEESNSLGEDDDLGNQRKQQASQQHKSEAEQAEVTVELNKLTVNETTMTATSTTESLLINLLDDSTSSSIITTTTTSTTAAPVSIATKIDQIISVFSTTFLTTTTRTTGDGPISSTVNPLEVATVTVESSTMQSLLAPTLQGVLPGTRSSGGSSANDYSANDNLDGNPPPVEDPETDVNVIIAISVSVIGVIALLLLVAFLYLMRKRQKQMSYGQRCRPVSLDAYSLDNVSVLGSVRRKVALRNSKRSYGNVAFDDPSLRHNLLTAAELIKAVERRASVYEEFRDVPQIIARADEVQPGCEDKNRYANVVPLPETRVILRMQNGDERSDYINANYVRGPKDSGNYYIACQAPLELTVTDFWRMIWEQQSRVIIQATDLTENGIEKCAEYLPPSVTLDNHSTYGDIQVTLKNREVKDRYAISIIMLRHLAENTSRELTHYWYKWPETGVPHEEAPVIAMLLEARSSLKSYAIEQQAQDMTKDKSLTLGLTDAPTVTQTPPSESSEHTPVASIEEINGNISMEKFKSASAKSSQSQSLLTVHCSPGTGRTGTIIACDIAIRCLEMPKRTVDIPQIVYYVRRGRASAVQTKDQYEFIYKVASMYATKITTLSNDN